MDFEQFETLKEGVKDNEGLSSLVSELETQVKTLAGNKEDAVGEIKKFKDVKHGIAELFGFEKDISTSDLMDKAKGTLGEYKRKIDSFKNDASGKDIENAQIKEQLSDLLQKVDSITKERDEQVKANELSNFKEKFRKAMSENRIKDPDKQDDVIRGYINEAMATDDINGFVRSIAEKKPYLTESVHNGGAGSKTYNGESGAKSLSDIDIKDTNARIAAIKAKREAKGK